MEALDDAASPKFSNFEPIIVDSEMGNPENDRDLCCFDPSVLQSSTPNANAEFDDMFFRPSSAGELSDAVSYLSPSNLNSKPHPNVPPNVAESHSSPSDTRSESPEGSSRDSSADSPPTHIRNTSLASDHSGVFSPTSVGNDQFFSIKWSEPDISDPGGSFVVQNGGVAPVKGEFVTETDLELSNKAMDSAFDFESAASSPSPLQADATLVDSKPKAQTPKSHLRKPYNAPQNGVEPASSSLPTNGVSPFVFQQPGETTPAFTAAMPTAPKVWHRLSSPSELEETFNGINMNAGSPLSSTLSPSLNFHPYSQPYEQAQYHPAVAYPMSNGGPSMFLPGFNVDFAPPRLTVHPTSLKSRVETQIPIKLTLYPMPPGVKKLRLPSHAISKPKFLAKPDVGPSPEIVHLSAHVFCTSALQDKTKRERALAIARGEELTPKAPLKTESSQEAQNEEDTPLSGAEVKICPGCIQRERKRASRKKQRKPEEDELFQKDEDKRVIVFNTTELKDWVDPPRTAFTGSADPSSPPIPPGSMQAELPMRIACYCRHQNEKLGFQVIFTVKDYVGNVLSQAITNSIMITDDHKTHTTANNHNNAAAAAQSIPDGQFPTAGVFAANPAVKMNKPIFNNPPFKVSHSATDLQALRNKQYPLSPEPSVPPQNDVNGTAARPTSRTLSRQASQKDLQGPSAKRRKQSGSKIPSGLTMTRLDGTQPGPAASNSRLTPSTSPLQQNRPALSGQADPPFVMPSSMTQVGNGPPTPGTNETAFFSPRERPQTVENNPQRSLVSAPNSAHPSRPGSPGPSSRNSSQDQATPGAPNTSTQNQMWGIPPSLPPPTMIHKLVPAEGSTTGGNEVTLLGSGFFPGMEVVFGDTLATTTTFWGDKCLNCLTPPALQPGTVPVVFKHEHPRFGPVQQTQPILPKQQMFFRYVDDRELQMYRVALNILGQKLRNPADAYQTAQQIMGGDPNTIWSMQGSYQSNGQQRGGGGATQDGGVTDLDAKMLVYLEFMDLDDTPGAPKYNLRSPAGQTLLHFACSLGLTRFVAGLLARGANADVQDNNGNAPLHLAAISGHTHIVHRLRLAGANVSALNIRRFTPADLASSLEVHQAVLIPSRHYRSRSVGSTQSIRRRPSSSSLDEFWDSSSSEHVVEDVTDFSQSESDEIGEAESNGPVADSTLYYPQSRRPSIDRQSQAGHFLSHSREHSVQTGGVLPSVETEANTEVERAFSPPAALVAWRDQLAGQINQFQQSVNRAFPNLPALPPMPTLPDYQTHPMIQRISSLVPHRPTSSWSTNIMKDGWDRLTGTLSPPAYEDLYPVKEEEDSDVKKASLAEAAIDAAADQHFETLEERPAKLPSPVREDIGDVQIGRKSITRHQQDQLRKAHAMKMKRIRSDRNLFFIWIPLLIIIACAMLRSLIPDLWRGVSRGYQFVAGYVAGHVEAEIPQ